MNQEIMAIQKATGEKMGTIIFGMFMTFSGLVVGMTKGWDLSLVILGCIPIVSVGFALSSTAL